MPLWIWFLLGIAVLVVLVLRARASFRKGVRDELVALMREHHPTLEVTSVSPDALELKLPGGSTGTLNLANLYTRAAAVPVQSEERARVVREFLEGVVSQQEEALQPLDLAKHGDRLRPLLVEAAFLGQAPEELRHSDPGLPGLSTAYVLDGEKSILYLTLSHLRDLGFELEDLHARALANLATTVSAEMVRGPLEQGKVALIKLGDGFDATRLLLVPGRLREGEELVALIPDRHTLGLAPLPKNGDFSGLQKLARTPASDYRLLDRPVRVTPRGFTLA